MVKDDSVTRGRMRKWKIDLGKASKSVRDFAEWWKRTEGGKLAGSFSAYVLNMPKLAIVVISQESGSIIQAIYEYILLRVIKKNLNRLAP